MHTQSLRLSVFADISLTEREMQQSNGSFRSQWPFMLIIFYDFYKRYNLNQSIYAIPYHFKLTFASFYGNQLIAFSSI